MLVVNDLSGPGFGPVDVQIGAGECLAITGVSGSGKTRLLRAIADLDPVSGTCELDDVSFRSIPATQWRRRVAYVPAEPGWWAATARDHFADPAVCDAFVDQFSVDRAALSRAVEEMSTGERQRMALARALEAIPEVLLLDEPTGPLDDAATELVEQEIKARMQAGVIVVLVTHETAQAERLGARMGAMVEGRLT